MWDSMCPLLYGVFARGQSAVCSVYYGVLYLQVSPPDVTGAQLVASGMGSGATSPNMSPRPGSVDDRLLGSHTMFPTVEDMPPSPTGSEDYYGTFFQSRSQKAHTDAMPLLDTGPSVLQNEHGGGRATRSATTDNQISVAMKPVDSGECSSAHPLPYQGTT